MRNIHYKTFIAIYNWMEEKSFKNFISLYRYGFTYTGRVSRIFSRPLWRCWRIFRNTYLNNRYAEIAADEDLIHFYLTKSEDSSVH